MRGRPVIPALLPTAVGRLLLSIAVAICPAAAIAQTQQPAAAVGPDIRLSSTIVADPLGSQRPKALPGALVEYELKVSNLDTRLLKNGGFAITSPVPPHLMLVVSSPASPAILPFQFERQTDAVVCRLSAPASTDDCLEFSSDGGANFDYVPNPGVDGVDSRISHVRFRISGPDAPNEITAFVLRYRMIME